MHAAQLATQLQQLQVNSDQQQQQQQQQRQLPSRQSMRSHVSLPLSWVQHESLAEEALIERMKELIVEFMNRSGRHYSYDTCVHWNLERCDQLKFSFVISIKHPSNFI